MRYLPLFTIAFVMTMAGCANRDCYDNQNSLPLAGFYTSAPSAKPVMVDSLTVYGIGAPLDTLLTKNATNISSIYLPFRIDGETTSYVFRWEALGGLSDTVTFHYKARPWFVSSECGVIYKYEVKDIISTGAIIDSVTCPDGVITNIPTENLRIYLHTDTQEL